MSKLKFRWVAAIGIVGVIAACGGGGGSGAGSDAGQPPSQSNRITVQDVRAHLIPWYPISGSGNNPENRNVGRGIPQNGWQPFVNNVVIPQTSSRGLKRVELHNPFGRRRDTPPPLFERAQAFQFDQYLEAQAAGVTGLTADFVQAWAPVTAMGYEVIAYIGSPFLDPDSQKLLDAGQDSAFDARAQAAIKPILDAGMSIAYDAAVSTSLQSKDYELVSGLREQGRNVYVEAGPRTTRPWWFDFSIISRDDTWRKRLGNDDFASPAMLKGEILRIARKKPAWTTLNSNQWPQEVCQIIADGDTAVVEDFIFRDPNRKLSSLADCANALIPGNT